MSRYDLNDFKGSAIEPLLRNKQRGVPRVDDRRVLGGKYPRPANRRSQPAGVLSGGERRLLEISRALVMEPDVLLVDEPSIGLEPRFIDQVFEILADLRDNERKTMIMVEQNAKKGLEFAEIGYVLVSGQLAKPLAARSFSTIPTSDAFSLADDRFPWLRTWSKKAA